MHLSQRTALLDPSLTLQINTLAKARVKEGLPVFNLSVGEPDFPTPEFIKQAAQKALADNFTRYTSAGGVEELKTAVAKTYTAKLNLPITSRQVTCASGGKQILYNLFQVLLDPGDEVLVFGPYWLSYKVQVELAGGILKEICTDPYKNFYPDQDGLVRNLTNRTKAIIINSPSNPAGVVLSREWLKYLSEFVTKHDLWLISDDVYDHFYFTSTPPGHILEIAPALFPQVISVNSVSKTFAMTGWRLGFAVGDERVIEKMEELQSHSASNPCSISQLAALAALESETNEPEIMRAEFMRRKLALMEFFSAQAKNIKVIEPQGAFYALVDIQSKKLSGESDLDFCLKLLADTGVAVVPGESFGVSAQGFIRISFAATEQVVISALGLLDSFRS